MEVSKEINMGEKVSSVASIAESTLTNGLPEDSYEKYFESEGEVVPVEVNDSLEYQEEEKQLDAKSDQDLEQSKKNTMVPLASFIKEKNRRKEMAKKMERMENTFQTIVQRMEQVDSPKEPPAPSYEEDPIGSLAHNQRTLQEQVRKQQEELSYRNQQEQYDQALQDLVGKYHFSAKEFQTKQPDFSDAYKFLVSSKMNEYEAIGMSPQDADRRLKEEELGIVQMAISNNVNPAEVVYRLAKTRGYLRKDIQDKFKTIERGIKTSRSLSSAGGTVKKNITLEQLAEMNPEDPSFQKYWKELIG